MAIKKPLVLKNGVTTELQSGDFLPLNAINGLSNDLDAIIKTIANISTANASFKNSSELSVLSTISELEITELSQSTNKNIVDVDGDTINISRDLPLSVLSTITADSSGGDLIVKFVDSDSGDILSSFTHTISSGIYTFRESSLLTVNRFLTPTNQCKVVIQISTTCEICKILDYVGVVLVSGGSGKVITTNPIPIINGVANIGYPVNGILLSTALVFLDLVHTDFDMFGRLINNRNYLIEEHFGVNVNGSIIEFPNELNGKYVVVSHIQ